jgi:hypothetical protein
MLRSFNHASRPIKYSSNIISHVTSHLPRPQSSRTQGKGISGSMTTQYEGIFHDRSLDTGSEITSPQSQENRLSTNILIGSLGRTAYCCQWHCLERGGNLQCGGHPVKRHQMGTMASCSAKLPAQDWYEGQAKSYIRGILERGRFFFALKACWHVYKCLSLPRNMTDWRIFSSNTSGSHLKLKKSRSKDGIGGLPTFKVCRLLWL